MFIVYSHIAFNIFNTNHIQHVIKIPETIEKQNAKKMVAI